MSEQLNNFPENFKEVLPDIIKLLKFRYGFLCDAEIEDCCKNIAKKIIETGSHEKCKNKKELFYLLYTACKNKIKNIIKKNERIISLEQAAADAGVDDSEI